MRQLAIGQVVVEDGFVDGLVLLQGSAEAPLLGPVVDAGALVEMGFGPGRQGGAQIIEIVVVADFGIFDVVAPAIVDARVGPGDHVAVVIVLQIVVGQITAAQRAFSVL